MGFLDAYNLAQQINVYGCSEPSISIYAATFIPAVAPALIEFVSFGCRDILKFRAGIGHPCGRMVKGQFKKALPPTWFDAAKKIMKFERAFSTAGFWWMIADLASDTALRWTTMAYKMNECGLLDQYATWTYTPFFDDVLQPNHPKQMVGIVTDYVGEPGHAYGSGAICPADWYCQLNFSVDYRPLLNNPPGTLTFWVQEEGGDNYDFPGNQYSPTSYPWQRSSGGYHFSNQNKSGHGRRYVMWAMASEYTIVRLREGRASVSATPPIELFISPMNCWKDFTLGDAPDPAGRNRKYNPPTILSPIFNAVTPKPVRGRPGGMPRSKK